MRYSVFRNIFLCLDMWDARTEANCQLDSCFAVPAYKYDEMLTKLTDPRYNCTTEP